MRNNLTKVVNPDRKAGGQRRKKMEIKQKVLEYCEKIYHNYIPTVVRVESDTVVVYLHNQNHNFLSGCKILYYNQNYNEYYLSDLVSTDD